MTYMEERLQKLLSSAGLCSRRTAERYIEAGRVTVNGVAAQLGDKADPVRDAIAVDGLPVSQAGRKVWLMLYKPVGYVTTLSDEKGRRTAASLVSDCGFRVWPVGRLDMDSEGLLLFTNDGEGTNRVLHPGHQVDKEYHVTVQGDVKAALPILQGPMELDGRPLAPARVEILERKADRGELSVVIHEGRNRQVRRMCALAGLTVTRLKRVREGDLSIGALTPGTWRWLTQEEIGRLFH